MITLGLVLAPQLIAQQKATGIYDFMFSLPVPRSASIAAGIAINGVIALPGVIIAVLVAVWRYDLHLAPRLSLLPAALLTVVTAAAIGHAMAHAIPKVMVTYLITQILVFVILLFSPIQFPADRLPAWLAGLHQGLPFVHAANVVRAGLTGLPAEGVGLSFLILGAWASISWLVTLRVVNRRR
jgi:ABC-2 type transport system permease protein